jgi:hypothetical protein
MNKTISILSLSALLLLAQTARADNYLTAAGKHNAAAVHTSFKSLNLAVSNVMKGGSQLRQGSCLFGYSLNKKGQPGDSFTLPDLDFERKGLRVVASIERSDGSSFELTAKNLDPMDPPESAVRTFTATSVIDTDQIRGVDRPNPPAKTNWSISVKNLSDKPVYVTLCLLESAKKTADSVTWDTVTGTMLGAVWTFDEKSSYNNDHGPFNIAFGKPSLIGGIVAKNTRWMAPSVSLRKMGEVLTFPPESVTLRVWQPVPYFALKPSKIMPVPAKLPAYQSASLHLDIDVTQIEVENPSSKPQFAVSLIFRQ